MIQQSGPLGDDVKGGEAGVLGVANLDAWVLNNSHRRLTPHELVAPFKEFGGEIYISLAIIERMKALKDEKIKNDSDFTPLTDAYEVVKSITDMSSLKDLLESYLLFDEDDIKMKSSLASISANIDLLFPGKDYSSISKY